MAQINTGVTEAMVYILVDRYIQKNAEGKVYFPRCDEYHSFTDLMAMLHLIDGFLDTLRSPQKTHDFRSFSKIAAETEREKGREFILNNKDLKSPETGGKATFVVKVRFRQNATFQGSIQWVDKGKLQNFRSALEMLKLIDEALEENGPQDKVGWDSK